MKKDRKTTILIALLVALGLSIGFRVMNPYRQATVDRLTYTGTSGRPMAPPENEPKHPFSTTDGGDPLGLVQNVTTTPHDGLVDRDIFSFRPLAQPETVTDTRENNPGPKKMQTEKKDKPEEREEIHLRNLKIFGAHTRSGKTTLFLERGKEVLVIREGDLIDGKYKVAELTETSLTLTGGQLKRPFVIVFEED